MQLTDYTWYIHGLLEKEYLDVIERLTALSYNAFVGNTFYIPTDMALASAYYLMNDSKNTQKYAESSLPTIEDQIQKNPEDPRFRSSLGLIFAYLNRKEEAIQEGLRSVEMLPLSKDAFDGPRYVLNLAAIYTIVGEYDRAIDLLVNLMSIAAGTTLSSSLIRIDPLWDPLREIPRFQQLLEQEN